MSARSRRRFQRFALVLLGGLVILVGARQLAYATGGHGPSHDRCEIERVEERRVIQVDDDILVEIETHVDGHYSVTP